jgi:hypothetical protein
MVGWLVGVFLVAPSGLLPLLQILIFVLPVVILLANKLYKRINSLYMSIYFRVIKILIKFLKKNKYQLNLGVCAFIRIRVYFLVK